MGGDRSLTTLMAQPHHWLAPLADSRQAGGGEQGPATTLQRRRGPGGLPTVALELRAASDSNGGGAASGGGPVGQLLLNAFLEATTPSARGRAGQQPAGGALQRGLEITLAQERGGEGQRAGDERPALRLQFAATEPAAAEQVEEATRLFEVSQVAGGRDCAATAVLTRAVPAVVGALITSVTTSLPHSACAAALHASLLPTHPDADSHVPRPPLQAFWQYHSKAAQSHLHSRMRARLGSLRQRLALARFDGT